MIKYLVVSCVMFSSFAAEAMEFRFISGMANFQGNLSSATNERMNAFGFGHRDIVQSNFATFGLGFDVLTTSTRHEANGFSFADEEELNLLVFQLMPSVCAERWHDVRTCFALGLGTVNVNSPKDRQDFGSWHYEWSVDWRAIDEMSIGFVTKYVGKVEQRMDGEDAEFWFWNYALGITYHTAN
jgi:hypothetical protein